ncbi:MAG: PH domain-containing protein [Lachnospiraceae bacterium]
MLSAQLLGAFKVLTYSLDIIYLSPLDFGSINFFIVNDSATITAPMYSDDFAPDRIEHVELIENLPALRKRHGGDSPTFYVGDFNVTGYGNCSVYVRRNNTPYIVITLDNRTIIFNGNTPEDTENYYLQLSELQASQ